MFGKLQVNGLIRLALAEDLGYGDITSELTIPDKHRSVAEIVAREKLKVCGLGLIRLIFEEMGADVAMRYPLCDGDYARDGTVLATLEGDTSQLLAAERTVLNFLQRLSGVATHVARIVEKANGLRVLDTRKTTPGWRYLEKYAVRVGGASNHRFHLGDMVLVKNNHVDAHGGDLRKTLKEVQQKKPPYMPMEIEVRDAKELAIALQFQPAVVLLDNMDDPQLRQALKVIAASEFKPLVEVSGGVSVEKFAKLKKLGISCVSMGALTTAAVNVDISMRLRARKKK